MTKIPVGISSCLLGESVRFDGGHKKDAYITGTLSHYFDFHPVCPEVAIGLGIPRPPIRLSRTDAGIRCVGVRDPLLDVTDRLTEYARSRKSLHQRLCGYILKKDSPSCGMERVKVFSGNMPSRNGTGFYTAQMRCDNPLMPMEEEGRLGDPHLRENFIQRVYVFYRWKKMLDRGLTAGRLTTFHARHKLIIMSRGDYAPLGRLLACADKENIQIVAAEYISALMPLLKNVASRGQHVNVLQHIQGYLKTVLTQDDKAELTEVIERYRCGEIPLIVPLTLLKHHFRKCPDPYIEKSWYMSPYPQEMQLINRL